MEHGGMADAVDSKSTSGDRVRVQVPLLQLFINPFKKINTNIRVLEVFYGCKIDGYMCKMINHNLFKE